MNKRENKPKFVRFTLRLPDEQWRQVKELAAQKGISASELLRRSIDSIPEDDLTDAD